MGLFLPHLAAGETPQTEIPPKPPECPWNPPGILLSQISPQKIPQNRLKNPPKNQIITGGNGGNGRGEGGRRKMGKKLNFFGFFWWFSVPFDIKIWGKDVPDGNRLRKGERKVGGGKKCIKIFLKIKLFVWCFLWKNQIFGKF